ncbi:hypothetical protein [Arthrobacter sp. A2-55]|uniref:hypothetical protein n=1 Tax=Arthrobacter sp. A2-55 TaxID=2897337 RepID=UPI0021CDC8C5|nr:hypothetical protein [Arthrobacter sp. A2-55]MCU6479011.1 hypothetical protein [Arthrobacter sp. A2-55]
MSTPTLSAPALQAREAARTSDGQFGTQHHSEAHGISLSPASPGVVVADAGHVLSPDGQERARQLAMKFNGGSLAGRIDAVKEEGSALTGKFTSADGQQLDFMYRDWSLDVWGAESFDLDSNHREASTTSSQKFEDGIPDLQLQTQFEESLSGSRAAQAWANHSILRSTATTKFGLPEVIESEGVQVARCDLVTSYGEYTVDVPRGGQMIVRDNVSLNELSPRVSESVILDAVEAGGGRPDKWILWDAIAAAASARIGERW